MEEGLLGLGPLAYWGIGLILVFPIIILILNEANYKLGSQDANLRRPITTFIYVVMPLGAAILLMLKVFNFNPESLSLKVLETILWIIIINTGLAFISRFFFNNRVEGTTPKIPQLFLDIFRIFLVLLGVAIVLSQVWGMKLSELVTALGLGSFVLGLALQDTLGNLFSGIALVYEKPFKVGDVINVGEHEGHVVEMNWRAVHIRTREGRIIVIPHLKIGQDVIVNHSKPVAFVMKHEITFSYADAPNKVKKAMHEVLANTPGVLTDPVPEVKTLAYDDSAIRYELEFGIEDYHYREEIADDLMSNIWYAAQRHQLTIPYKQVTITQGGDVIAPALSNEQSKSDGLLLLQSILPIHDSDHHWIKESCDVLKFAKHEKIYDINQPTGTLYLVLDGAVDLCLDSHGAHKITTLHIGELLGEIPLLAGRQHIMSAIVKHDTTLLTIPLTTSSKLLNNNTEMITRLNKILDARRMLAMRMEANA